MNIKGQYQACIDTYASQESVFFVPKSQNNHWPKIYSSTTLKYLDLTKLQLSSLSLEGLHSKFSCDNNKKMLPYETTPKLNKIKRAH